jgi:hypothetical protein
MSCTSCGNNAKKSKSRRVKDVIIAAINHPYSILKAHYRTVIKDESIESIAKPRLVQCYNCKDKKLIATILNKQIYICGYCSCPIESKARDLNETCSLNKW